MLLYGSANGQTRTGFEGYYYSGCGPSSSLVSRLHFEDHRGWYGEARYNYDAEQTFSLNAGRTFAREGTLGYSFTPMAGILAGKTRAISTGVNVAMDRKGICFSSELQYVFSAAGCGGDFLYSWSELGYQATGYLYTGIALQQLSACGANIKWEPGIQVSITCKKWRFPVYLFNPFAAERYFVMGISYDWEFSKRHL